MTTEPTLTDVSERAYLAVDGEGDPDAPAFGAAVTALYAAARADLPLEGLWWSGDDGELDLDDRDNWRWTLLLPAPDDAAPAADGPVRLQRLHEGRCAEVLHVGPYEAEAPTIARLHAFIAAQGLERAGRHHEIYLDDPRTTPPERLRTLLRQPVAPAA